MTAAASTCLYFAAVSPGLESLLAAELGDLGLDARPSRGGVEWRSTIENLWLVHNRSRLAESVRARLRPFRAAGFGALEQGLMRLPWHAYLRRDLPVRFSVSCHKSKLFHSGAVEQRARSAVAARLGACVVSHETIEPTPAPSRTATPSVGPHEHSEPDGVTRTDCEPVSAVQEIHLRLDRDEVQASVEASGELLHRRGYRTHVGTAPLRETLAAACARLLDDAAPHRADVPVWDPCCGSGTLLTEWLLRGSAGSVCSARRFAFELWPIHDRARYEAWRHELETQVEATSDLSARVFVATNLDWSARLEGDATPQTGGVARHALGSDRDARVLVAARHNAERAGVAAQCDWLLGDFREAVGAVPGGYRVLSNLPYGKRLADSGLAERAFAALDEALLLRPDLRPALLLSACKPPARVRCRWEALARFSNGGLGVTAWLARG